MNVHIRLVESVLISFVDVSYDRKRWVLLPDFWLE